MSVVGCYEMDLGSASLVCIRRIGIYRAILLFERDMKSIPFPARSQYVNKPMLPKHPDMIPRLAKVSFLNVRE